MKRIGLALCEYEKSGVRHLFQMPRYANLQPGDFAVVDTSHGEQTVKVVQAVTTYTEEDSYKMILAVTRAKLPLKKVLRKVISRPLEYDREDLSVFDDEEVIE